MRSKGWGPFTYDWYSICSAHRDYRDDCPRCNAGLWYNRYWRVVDHQLYVRWPVCWRLVHNLPWSRTRRFIRKTFPNAR